ncbi:hypothetical protein BV22DRAFT_1192224 [Leucogyrophana mollusca]|uniref:Uncharacterized protein n=1 Tax=Leucogyrophana mollusca TaxID=85980 RepID=A0ACB8BT49_9AGAM|nr:hypothetical protein BV22DRAFT_1192224 [Leucogyrophana mollusca]
MTSAVSLETGGSFATTHATPVSYSWRSFMGPFPTEILRMIFKLVYQNHLKELCWDTSYGQTALRALWDLVNHDFASGTLFPYSLAAVCPSWCDILSSFPEFWTRVVISIDARPTPLSDVRSYLQWSRDLPITVIVTRRDDKHEKDYTEEKNRVDAVIGCISEQLFRCETLRVNVIYSSSLPQLRKHFRGEALRLKNLLLESADFGGVDVPDDTSQPLDILDLRCPFVERLYVDGWNFRDVCVADPAAIRWNYHYSSYWFCQLQNLSDITISRYKASENGGRGLSMKATLKALAAMPRLHSLSIRAVEFDNTVIDRDSIGFEGLWSLDLQDLGPNALILFSRAIYTYTDAIAITRCHINFAETFKCNNLTFSEIAKDQDFQWLLKRWNGRELDFVSCEGFNDDLIVSMGGGYGKGPFLCPRMHTLSLWDCTDFTFMELRRMCAARVAEAKEELGEGVDVFDTPYNVSVRPLKVSVNGRRPEVGREEWRNGNVLG